MTSPSHKKWLLYYSDCVVTVVKGTHISCVEVKDVKDDKFRNLVTVLHLQQTFAQLTGGQNHKVMDGSEV